MLMHPKKRIEVIIEAPLVERLLAVLDAQQVSGYTVLPALGGRGRGGRWRRDGLVGEAGHGPGATRSAASTNPSASASATRRGASGTTERRRSA